MATIEPTRRLNPTQLWPIRFRLRSLLLVVTLLAVGLGGWIATLRSNEQRRQAVVSRIVASGGSVGYDYYNNPNSNGPPGPLWLRRLAGDKVFAEIESVRDGHSIADKDVEALMAFRYLKDLDLKNNKQVKPDTLSMIRHLPRLYRVILSGTNLEDESFSEICASGSLVELHARRTKVTRLSTSGERENSRLRTLDLSFAPLSPSGLDSVYLLPALEELIVDSVNIDGQSLTSLRQAKSLTLLSIRDTKISDDDIPVLSSFEHLKLLYIYKTKLTDEGRDKLLRARPGLKAELF